MLDGSCHCGAITLQLATNLAPAELPVRMCGCTFCRKHRPRYTSDPAGQVAITLERDDSASRYRFGLGLADFLVCRTCGVFVAAFDPVGRAVVNLEVLACADDFTAPPLRFTAYDTEDAAARLARRARNWSPATLAVRPPRT